MFQFNPYGFVIAIAFFISFLYLFFRVRQYRLPSPFGFLLGILLVTPFALVGARLWTLFSPHFWEMLMQKPDFGGKILFLIGIQANGTYHLAGLSLHGALVFGFFYLLFFFRWYGKKYLYSELFCFDFFLPVVLIFQIIGRWGNFFNRELLSESIFTNDYPNEFGWIPTWFANYLHLPRESANILRHPLFLYESFANLGLLIFIFGLWPFLMRRLSPRPWLKNVAWEKEKKEYQKVLQNLSFWKWKYWKWTWKNFRFTQSCWKKARHNPEISYHSAPQIMLSPRFWYYGPTSSGATTYAQAQRLIYRDYHGLKYHFKLWQLFFYRNSFALTNYFNPYRLKLPRVGTYLALYLIGYSIIRMGLQSLRFANDTMEITIPFSIFMLIGGVILFIFSQWIAPSRFRSLGWFYETRY